MPEADLLATYGLPGLFVMTVLAGSFVPLPSDALLAAMIYRGEPVLVAVGIATLGNTLGAATIYWFGLHLRSGGGGPLGRFVRRRLERNPAKLERARLRVAKYGAPALAFTWIPIVGDALVLAAALLGIRWAPFLAFTTTGKAVRFGFVAASALAAAATTG